MLLTTQVTVDLSYVLKDGDTGEELWAERQTMVYVLKTRAQEIHWQICL